MTQALNSPSGYLFIDKPEGLPSFSIVRRLKRRLGVKKIGFAGTLDPFSSGLLIMGVGRDYTRHLDAFHKLKKTYKVVLTLGVTTDTLDSYGVVTKVDSSFIPTKPTFLASDQGSLAQHPHTEFARVSGLDQAMIEHTLQQFKGDIMQKPPAFSAKKIKGKRLYKMARGVSENELASLESSLQPVPVTIYELTVLAVYATTLLHIELEITCSKGTYIRCLCRDIAASLGTVGYAKNLIRTQIGDITLSHAQRLPTQLEDDFEPSFCANPLVFETGL